MTTPALTELLPPAATEGEPVEPATPAETDPTAETLECLDILLAYSQQGFTGVDPDEFETALWQTAELAVKLLVENQQAWNMVRTLEELVHPLQWKLALAEKKANELWSPHGQGKRRKN